MNNWKQTFIDNKKDVMKLIIMGLTLIVSSIIGILLFNKGIEYVFVVTVITTMLIVLYFLNLVLLHNLQTEKIAEIIEEYRAHHQLSDSEWYFTMGQLENFEFNHYIKDKSNQKKEVWVISRFLEHDHVDSHLAKKIKNNILKNNVTYKYIVPNSDDHTLYNKLVKLHHEFVNEYNQNNPFIVLCNESFDYPCDILIFQHSNINKVTVFMELRVTENPEERKWAKIENSSAIRILNNIDDDISSQGVCVPFNQSKFRQCETS